MKKAGSNSPGQKILQLIMDMTTTPDCAREHHADTSCACSRHAATHLKSGVDSCFRIEIMYIHRPHRLDPRPLQVLYLANAQISPACTDHRDLHHDK